VVDKETGEKVGVWKDPHSLPTPFALQSVALGKWFNNALMIWDASGPTGEVFTKTVVKSGYGHIYYRRDEQKVSRKITDKPGEYLVGTARTTLFEDYRDALGNHHYINRSEPGMNECLQFIRKPDGSIEHAAAANSQDPAGARTAHGDEAVADALACRGMVERQEGREPTEPELPVGSLAWRQQQKRAAEMVAMHDALGSNW
jgi:hypothetical protein